MRDAPSSGGEETDAALLKRFARGQPDAMERLVQRHGSTVYAFVRRILGNEPLADDVYQEVWLKVIRYANRFEGRSRFSTWLFQVTRNVCMDHRRSAQRKKEGVSLERDGGDPKDGGECVPLRDQVADRGPGTHERAAETEEKAALEHAIAQLPEEQREVLLLREKTELTFEEIAEISGLSPNTVKSRMRYALLNLRKSLGGVAHGL
jgi:RNA polymerase sigma-70 factor (ECF subfamily)